MLMGLLNWHHIQAFLKFNHYVKSEIDIMSIIKHKNIIKLIDTFENEEYIFIVMEYMKGGNLTSYLKKKHFCISERKTKWKEEI